MLPQPPRTFRSMNIASNHRHSAAKPARPPGILNGSCPPPCHGRGLRAFASAILVPLILTCLLPAAANAENLFPNGDFEDPISGKQWVPAGIHYGEEKHSGDFSMRIPKMSRDFVISSEFIEVDPASSYRLNAFVKVPSEGRHTEVQMGLRYYDQAQNEITPTSVRPVPGSDAVLESAAAEGTQVVQVKTDQWPSDPLMSIVFDTKEDYSDLPNLSGVRVTGVSQNGAVTEVKLKEPLPSSYPAGTPVRLHHYTDYANHSFQASDQWEEQTLTIQGEAQPGLPSAKEFWNKTRFVKVFFFPGIDAEVGDRSVELLIDDVTLTKE